MKKGIYFLLISLFSGGIFAQTLPEGMVSLLPEGVFANIIGDQKETQVKNLVVTGSEIAGYVAFFAANDGTHGEELWVTDGTPAGTRMVKDINPGPGGSDVNWMARFNDKVVFAADDVKTAWHTKLKDTVQDLLEELNAIDEARETEVLNFQIDTDWNIVAHVNGQTPEDCAWQVFWSYVSIWSDDFIGSQEVTNLIDVGWDSYPSGNPSIPGNVVFDGAVLFIVAVTLGS